MIKNIVFDLGKVLLEYEPEKYLLSKYTVEIANILHENIFSSPVWLDLDRGVISNEEAMVIISEHIPEYSEDVSYLLSNWTDILKPVDEMINLLCDLKGRGYNVFLITNFHKEAFYKVFPEYEFFKIFDKYILSSEVYLLKPEIEIFELLCEYCEIVPAESLFIDDSYKNIETAKEMGFKIVHHKNPNDSVIETYNLLKGGIL